MGRFTQCDRDGVILIDDLRSVVRHVYGSVGCSITLGVPRSISSYRTGSNDHLCRVNPYFTFPQSRPPSSHALQYTFLQSRPPSSHALQYAFPQSRPPSFHVLQYYYYFSCLYMCVGMNVLCCFLTQLCEIEAKTDSTS